MSKFSLSKESFSQVFDQIETLKSYYGRLSDRERYIVLGICVGSYIVILGLFYMLVASSVSSVASKINTSKKSLVEMEELSQRMTIAKSNVDNIEKMIRRTDVDFQLATELERIARKHNVSIDALKDRAGQPNELYDEIQSTIKLSGVNIRTLIQFLFDIENGSKLMRISSLQIKPNFKDPGQLNVSFVVSTFKMKEKS